MPISEMQCRWVVQILKGNVGIDTRDQMLVDMEKKRKAMQKRYGRYISIIYPLKNVQEFILDGSYAAS